MAEFDYDFFVIGAGSGGVRAARTAAALGARTGIAEERYFGGTCVNVGCVPKKLYTYAAHFQHDFADSRGYGWTLEQKPEFDWATLLKNKDMEISRLNGIYKNMLDAAGVKIHAARATIVDRHQVEVDGRRISAEHILIATGGWPWMPDIPGIEHAISSNEFFELDTLPAVSVVVGGGYISVELSGILANLGSAVSVVHRRAQLLGDFDPDVAAELTQAMGQYCELKLETEVTAIERQDDGRLEVHFSDGGRMLSDIVLFATGRRPNTSDLGLEGLGVRTQGNGALVVDDFFATSVDGLYAVGDVINRVALTPVALSEGEWLARRLFGEQSGEPDYAGVPSAVFSQPQVASVGLTEPEARTGGRSIDVYRTRFRHMKHTLGGREERTFMKMLVDRETDRVLGLHMVGEDAAEIIQGMAVAMKAGATKADFDATIGIHPSAAEEFVTMRHPD